MPLELMINKALLGVTQPHDLQHMARVFAIITMHRFRRDFGAP
jgi:hypothetical protein